MPDTTLRFCRPLIKLSGEAMSGPGGFGIDPDRLARTAGQLARAAESGAQLAVVPGGGNIIRGATLAERGQVSREAADQMGMLGTVMNGIALRDALERQGQAARLVSSLEIRSVAEPFATPEALRAMQAGEILILAAGTGLPFVTTDTGAALRAAQLGCDAILKATKVDGVYTADPQTDPKAERIATLPLAEAVDRRLKVMDLTAMELCREHGMSVVVFDFFADDDAVAAVLRGDDVGTAVTPA
jgi:uridylate kinase